MYSKLAVVCVAALAVVAQAGHQKRHTHTLKNGTLTYHPFDHNHEPSGYPGEAGVSSGVAPYPTGTGGSFPLSTGASPPLSTGAVPTYTTTEIVTKLITYCPGPTVLTQNGKKYTVTTVWIHKTYKLLLVLMRLGNNTNHFRMPVHVYLYNHWLSHSDSIWRHYLNLRCGHWFLDHYRCHHHPQHILQDQL